MKQFKDTAGRDWLVSITVGDIKRVRAVLDINLNKALDNRFAILTDILSDPCKLVDILYVLCQEQTAKAGVTDEQFGRAFSGDVLDAATTAFLEALTDFFPTAARAAMQAILAKGKEAGEILTQRMNQQIANLSPEQVATLTVSSGSSRESVA